MSVSEGSRPFTRYGYADFLREDRPYDVVFRLWAGTQRLLLWGDPAIAAGYGRVSTLAGTNGLEWCEPLTFRAGRARAARLANGLRGPVARARRRLGEVRLHLPVVRTPHLRPGDAARAVASVAPRAVRTTAPDAEAALASASRILPLVTTAHHPSASNNYFWPELYTDMPIVWSEEGTRPHPYLDTPTPRRFGTVEPSDPEVFSSVSDFVAGAPGRRAQRTRLAPPGRRVARAAGGDASGGSSPSRRCRRPDAEARRWIVDVRILAALGRFFAGKLRSAVARVHTATGSREALRSPSRRTACPSRLDGCVDALDRRVSSDLAFGPQPWLRGHWADRMPAIDADLRDMEGRWSAGAGVRQGIMRLADSSLGDAHVPRLDVHHAPAGRVPSGEPLELRLQVRGGGADRLRGNLRYRPMNQALPFPSRRWSGRGTTSSAASREPLSGARYPLAYAFVLHDERRRGVAVPGARG